MRAAALRADCSACIRSNLRFQEQSGAARCPLCRKPAAEHALRANLALRDLVAALRACRPLLLQMAGGAAAAAAASSVPAADAAGLPDGMGAAPGSGGENGGNGGGGESARPRRACRHRTGGGRPTAADDAFSQEPVCGRRESTEECSADTPEVVDLTQAEEPRPRQWEAGGPSPSSPRGTRPRRKRPAPDPDPEFTLTPTPST